MDFGLVLDRSFQLSRDERAFFDRNTHYDYGQFLFIAFRYLVRKYEKLLARKKEQIRERYGFSESLGRWKISSALRDNLEDIHASGALRLEADYVQTVIKYRKIATLISAFYTSMFAGSKKNTRHDNPTLKRLLKKATAL